MNSDFLKKQEYELEFLTPVHVGSGENDLEKVEYLYAKKNQVFYVVDSGEMIKLMKEENLMNEYLKYLQLNHKKNKIPLLQWLKSHELSKTNVVNRITRYKLSTKDLKTDVDNQVKGMVKSVFDEPYLPGSSIKGAIRTAIAIDYILTHPKDFGELRYKLKGREKIGQRDVEKMLIEPIFKEIYRDDRDNKFEHWLTSGLAVSDSAPMKLDEMMLVQKIELFYEDNTIGELPIIMEAMKPKTKTRLSMTIDKKKLGSKLGFSDFKGLEEILKRVEEFYIGKNGIYRIFENLDVYLPVSQPEDRLLFIGSNTGFQSKTVVAALFDDPEERLEVTKKILAPQFKQHKHEKDQGVSPRTLKIVDVNGEQLMGICALRKADGKQPC